MLIRSVMTASQRSKRVYLMGIAGTGMGSLAGLLKQLGYEVSGSDQAVYPPMSDKLREWEIPYFEGYAEEHLHDTPDLLVVGNVIRSNNPEALYARKHGIPTYSMPEVISELAIENKHSIVVSGTHGKSTTTALLAHAFTKAKRDPSFLVGGALVGMPESFHAGQGAYFVIEGDEYDTAYFDKGPKFVHYKPKTLIITSLEYDHADIYASVEAIEASFRKVIELVPEDGHIVVWAGAERAVRLVREHGRAKRVTIYGAGFDANFKLLKSHADGEGTTITAQVNGEERTATIALWGPGGVENSLAAMAVLWAEGFSNHEAAHALAGFAGVHRRMEVCCEHGGVTVVDDFAHHPTAIDVTVKAARARFGARRLWAIFEPRSASTRRNIFQEALGDALALADCVVMASHSRLMEVPDALRLSPESIVKKAQQAGKQAWFIEDTDAIATHVASHAQPGDVVLVMSNGNFEGLIPKLDRALHAKL